MKLYIYDHCPFCVRARMIFGLRNVAVDEVVLLNDDETTPISLIGAKQVPILQKPDGSHMGESLDIVNWVNEYAEYAPLAEAREAVNNWFQQVSQYYNRLVMPRDIQLGLAEFATPEAIAYFVNKKEAQMGKFADFLNDSDELISKINADLVQLNSLIQSDEWFNGKDLSLEDIILFPVLRNLTMVRGVVFPEPLFHYIQQMSAKSGVDLYLDRAI